MTATEVRLVRYRQSHKVCRCSKPYQRHWGFRWAPAGEMQGPNYRHYVQWPVGKKEPA